MNNVKLLSFILLLSLGVSSLTYTKHRNSSCNDCSTDCSVDRSNDCDDCSVDCDGVSSNCTSTFLRPRSITQDLTYRNNLSFYNWYHDARCNFFTWDSTVLYQRNRRSGRLGLGFFGHNPLNVAEVDGDVNSLNLGLGSEKNDGFESVVTLCPERSVVAWLPQFRFNLDCFCTGLWADVAFAVARARHKLRFFEKVETEGEITDNSDPIATNVREALNANNAFARDCKRTHVDDIDLRLGYDWNYCANDHAGIYLLGTIPTGKRLDHARWFQPLVGSRHGAIGIGLQGDYSIWNDEASNCDLVLMTDIKYQFRFRRSENRLFDLNNGPLSRYLLIAEEGDESNPRSALTEGPALTELLTNCVRVEPRHNIEWWVGLHYQWCNWGVEGSYNLWWRDREKICKPNFDFNDFGIFDQHCPPPALTSDSGATIDQDFGKGTPDENFTSLTSSDVNLASGAARRVLTHKISVALSYTNVLSDCYPWYVGFGGGYEFASNKHRQHAFENWHVYGKAAISF